MTNPILISSVNAGRFGPYVKHGEQFISLPKGQEPLDVDLDTTIKLIEEKQKADAPITQYENLPVTKGKGRFGPFIKWNDLFINVPRAYNFDALQEKDIVELIEKKISKEAKKKLEASFSFFLEIKIFCLIFRFSHFFCCFFSLN